MAPHHQIVLTAMLLGAARAAPPGGGGGGGGSSGASCAADGSSASYTESITTKSGVSVRKILLVLMLGASSAFATPIGYQTNLMVLRPGKYRFADYLKLGGPLTALAAVTIATVAYLVPDEWIP